MARDVRLCSAWGRRRASPPQLPAGGRLLVEKLRASAEPEQRRPSSCPRSRTAGPVVGQLGDRLVQLGLTAADVEAAAKAQTRPAAS